MEISFGSIVDFVVNFISFNFDTKHHVFLYIVDCQKFIYLIVYSMLYFFEKKKKHVNYINTIIL